MLRIPQALGRGPLNYVITTINHPHPFTIAASSADTAGEIYTDRQVSILIIGENQNVATGAGLDAVAAQDPSVLTAGFMTNRFISLQTPSFISTRGVRTPEPLSPSHRDAEIPNPGHISLMPP
eukprot:jgi/Ulvmu1/4019/UM189_0001.1